MRTVQQAVRDTLDRLGALLPAHEARIRRDALRWLASHIVATHGDSTLDAPVLLAALVAAADAAFGAFLELDNDMARLNVEFQAAATEQARREILTERLRTLAGPGSRAHERDVRALSRWLDLEAVQERMMIRIACEIDQIEVAYRAARALTHELEGPRQRLAAFGGGQVLGTAFRHATHGRRSQVRTSALELAWTLLRKLPAAERLRSMGSGPYRQACAWARGEGATRWMQVAALQLVTVAAPGRAVQVLGEVLADRDTPGRMVARRNAVRLVAEEDVPATAALDLVRRALDDPSEHVRQQCAWTLAALAGQAASDMLLASCTQDPSPRVRGVAVRASVTRALAAHLDVSRVEAVLESVLRDPAHELDAAVALESVARLCIGPQPASRKARFVEALNFFVVADRTPPTRAEEAAALLRRLEVESASLLNTLSEHFAAALARLPEGKTKRIRVPEGLRLRDVELALATAARGDLSVSLRPLGPNVFRLQRGEPRALRVWRLLHELRSPAPDKRKAFNHSHARVTGSGSVVPSHLLSEVTPTRVPGERRLSPSVGGWGPFLPRVDDLLQAARPFSPPRRIVTSLGVTTVAGPRGVLLRLWALIYVTLRYERLDRLRERAINAQNREQRERYTTACEALGYSFSLGDTTGRVEDRSYDVQLPRIAQYMAGVISFDLRPYLDGPVQYVLSPTGNAPWQVAVLVWLVLSGFIIRSAYIMGCIERARRAIPVSIGGWGTRGKSGTERLKAALFHAMRYDVVVKTTGCEAMFIHARRDLPAREIFLYRPYDKATIWEQRKVLEFGERLGAHVFLWECMALNPRFVEVLNRDWMQDRVTTLTNAYPDHEDVMGPSGEDVARVIGLFTPRGGTTYTSEEQMLPILRELARRNGSRLVAIPALEADLLPLDLLARFPYDEHPRNIALVLALAEHYGIDREFALVEIGDRVVPDLGVLKTYPEVDYRGRRLVFSNGMSANERAGFLSNWTRLGFDTMDPDAEPGTVSVAVVNNRADRVPRSRVFAEILTRDVQVDVIVLIGTNLSGMAKFIEESLEAELGQLELDAEGGVQDAERLLDGWLRRVGMGTRPETLDHKLRQMLLTVAPESEVERWLHSPEVAGLLEARKPGVGPALLALVTAVEGTDASLAHDVATHAERLVQRFGIAERGRREMLAQFEKGALGRAAEVAREMLRTLHRGRLHILEDAGTKGDGVIEFTARHLPPGHRARLLGCQNIKGTGLDFVYRWLSLQAVVDALQRLEDDPTARGEGLAWLITYSDYGIVDCQLALRTLDEISARQDPSWEPQAALLESAREHLRRLEAKKRSGLSATKKKTFWERALDGAVEPLIDHWDSTRRSAVAERVMQDLFDVRVGQGRAALLLRDTVARQKGGWLSREVQRLLRRR